MHRRVLAVLLAGAALVLSATRADAQATAAPCGPNDLGCAVTSGLTDLSTSLGAPTTTVPAPRTTTSTTRPVATGLGAVAASSAGAVIATTTGADALATVSPPAANLAQLVLPPLAIPDFGRPPSAVAPPVPTASPVGRHATATAPARPAADPGPSNTIRALGASLAAAAVLVLASLAVRRHKPTEPPVPAAPPSRRRHPLSAGSRLRSAP